MPKINDTNIELSDEMLKKVAAGTINASADDINNLKNKTQYIIDRINNAHPLLKALDCLEKTLISLEETKMCIESGDLENAFYKANAARAILLASAGSTPEFKSSLMSFEDKICSLVNSIIDLID